MRNAPPQFEPSYFDMATGGEMPAADGCCEIIGALASTAKAFPEWVLESAGEACVALGPVESSGGRATISFAALGRRGEIALAPDPSGWVLVTCHIEGQERFRAYLDRVWEEYEFHPAGAANRPESDADAPGRMGKRRNWINIDMRLWPALEPLANRFGYVVLSIRE
jgi:hypothetical protein